MHQKIFPLISYSAYRKNASEVFRLLRELGETVHDSGIENTLAELLKIRISQINRCAFCLQVHLNMARKIGIPSIKIDLISIWREVNIYSEREYLALAWAEALTEMNQCIENISIYDDLKKVFSEKEICFLTASIATINASNRIAGGLRFSPPPPSEAEN